MITTAMAQRKGLSVPISFNTHYDRYLPQAVGHDILIETHDGVPTVDLSVLEEFFPGASRGLHAADGAATIGDTKIVFVDFSKLVAPLEIEAEGSTRSLEAVE